MNISSDIDGIKQFLEHQIDWGSTCNLMGLILQCNRMYSKSYLTRFIWKNLFGGKLDIVWLASERRETL